MTTVLTTPISVTETATKQKVDQISIDLRNNQLGFYVHNLDADDNILESIPYVFQIWNESQVVQLPAAIETAARSLFQAIVTAARNQGYIGAGTDSNDI